MINLKLFLVILISCLIASCAVPYAKKGSGSFKGGYEDKKLGSGHFSIQVEGNGYTSFEVIEGYFHRRANELCDGKQYSHSIERTTTQHKNYYAVSQYTLHNFPVVIGEIKCDI